MGVFRFFKKNKAEPTDEQKKWNKMWDLWAEGRADSPYAELMTYQSEINNGGHDQYFSMLRIRAICKEKWQFWKPLCLQSYEKICKMHIMHIGN